MTEDESTSTNSTSGEGTVRLEVCARCGHMTPTCDRCGQSHLFLGGYINGKRYCHSFAAQPSCYMQALWMGDIGLRVTNELGEVLPVRRRAGGPGPWIGDDPAVDVVAVQMEIRRQLAELETEE